MSNLPKALHTTVHLDTHLPARKAILTFYNWLYLAQLDFFNIRRVDVLDWSPSPDSWLPIAHCFISYISKSLIDIADYFGFAGRSHFARYYKQQFLETPRQTLVARRHNEKKF